MKTVLGFSGGVDSAVSCMLLKKSGHEVLGVYLDNSGPEALIDAVKTAEFAGIDLKIIDVKQQLEENVCSKFEQCYLNGETPNPCIICNPRVKFKNLLEIADISGADFIATGHYARAESGALYKGNPENDQSYMLCRVKPEQLKRLILPLGAYPKREVRAMAEGFKLPVAQKPDSMEICFIPDKDYIGWLKARTKLPGPGRLIFHGEDIGEHRGIVNYTVGQRFPGLVDGRKIYISGIDSKKNIINLALWEELFKTEVKAVDFNWLLDMPDEFRATVKVRHTKWENPGCTVYKEDNGLRIVCDEAVRAPAKGQSAVLYDADRVIGGGFII